MLLLPQANLYPSKMVSLAVWLVLKSGGTCAFYQQPLKLPVELSQG